MTAVEFLESEMPKLVYIAKSNKVKFDELINQAKEMGKEQIGYSESDMRSYASYILNNPVIEPSQWYKIYQNKSE